MTRGATTSSLAATYLGPVTEGFTYPGTGFTFQPPGSEPPIVTWQAAAEAAHLVAVLSDSMSRTVELAYVTCPVFGPIQPDGSADVSRERILAYVVLTKGVPCAATARCARECLDRGQPGSAPRWRSFPPLLALPSQASPGQGSRVRRLTAEQH